ncbi:universal stress protein [Motiliproteus coralliicola]|uniref:Universal stress protein n=1 Tax=Motiliproteus coralliicola TaxID=2283196 RepID=A0A369WA01_9GAMM|nr:universal stress protein [Motiliproteus coralliicola]RDE18009.1 universal stress protein [Motiliproteus coralliicola]
MLPTTNHILYASDLGKGSRPAFHRAVAEAIKHDAQITYLHVMEPMNSTSEAMVESYLSQDSMASLRQRGVEGVKVKVENRIKAFIDEELDGVELPKGEPLKQVRTGRPHEVILETAKELNVDMIVMGTRTHSSFGQLLLGSTAQKVLHHSKAPVMVVPL